jgi:hypothetical protein
MLPALCAGVQADGQLDGNRCGRAINDAGLEPLRFDEFRCKTNQTPVARLQRLQRVRKADGIDCSSEFDNSVELIAVFRRRDCHGG